MGEVKQILKTELINFTTTWLISTILSQNLNIRDIQNA